MARNRKKPMDTRNISFAAEKKQTIIQYLKWFISKQDMDICSDLAQINLKDSDKCMYGSEQTTSKHLWKSCPKSELKHLHNIEPNLRKLLQDKNKYKEFRLLVKEMEKIVRDEENAVRNTENRIARWTADFWVGWISILSRRSSWSNGWQDQLTRKRERTRC